MNKLECGIVDFEYNIQYDVKYFEIEIINEKKIEKKINQGAVISNENKAFLGGVQSGDKVLFTNILAVAKDNQSQEQKIDSKIVRVE